VYKNPTLTIIASHYRLLGYMTKPVVSMKDWSVLEQPRSCHCKKWQKFKHTQ